MEGEERTPLLAGEGQRQELQGHGLRVHGLQVQGLQGHGQVGSEGQEEVARRWLPWTALALAVLAGVTAGLQVFSLAVMLGAASLIALGVWIIRRCKRNISARRRVEREDVENYDVAAGQQGAKMVAMDLGIKQRLRQENAKLEINALMIPTLTIPEASSRALPIFPTIKTDISINFHKKSVIPTVTGSESRLKLLLAKDSATAPQNICGQEIIYTKPKNCITKSQSALDLVQEAPSEDVKPTERQTKLPKYHSTMALLQAVAVPEKINPEIEPDKFHDFKCPGEKKFFEQVKVSSTPRSRIPKFERTSGLETPSPRVLKPKIPTSQIPLFKDSKIQTPRIKIPDVPKF